MKALGTSLASLPEDEDARFWHGSEEADAAEETTTITSNQDKDDDDTDQEDTTLTGVLFGRSVRAHYASLDLVVIDKEDEEEKPDDNDQYHVMVRIQFQTDCQDATQQLRSYMRRYCKNGDLIHITKGTYRGTTVGQTEWQNDRFVVDVQSVEEATQLLQLRQAKYWGMSKWQAWQTKVYRQNQRQSNKKKSKITNKSDKEEDSFCQAHHSGGLEKRQQGEFLANFLLNMIAASRLTDDEREDPPTTTMQDPSTWANIASSSTNKPQQGQAAALEYLNSGTGVLDVAGGSGHVSMALGMLGIQSTVVDPREAVGKLPGRDRKIWNRAVKGKKKKQQQPQASNNGQYQEKSQSPSTPQPNSSSPSPDTTTLICQPAVQVRPYETFRAWFGAPPKGVDTDFRNPDKASVPVCDAKHSIVQNCGAIVALHPDEATDAIVDVAVERRIPFVIVPCCVFCRLFPNRRMPGDDTNSGGQVSTYQDLLQYLQAKDPSIQKATLPFIGANTVLYSTFEG